MFIRQDAAVGMQTRRLHAYHSVGGEDIVILNCL